MFICNAASYWSKMLIIHEDHAWNPYMIPNMTITHDDQAFVFVGIGVIMTANETRSHAYDLHVSFLSIFASQQKKNIAQAYSSTTMSLPQIQCEQWRLHMPHTTYPFPLHVAILIHIWQLCTNHYATKHHFVVSLQYGGRPCPTQQRSSIAMHKKNTNINNIYTKEHILACKWTCSAASDLQLKAHPMKPMFSRKLHSDIVT